MNSAISIAGSYLPEGKAQIVNQLEVGGGQQVMLEVTISEVSRTAAKDLGFSAELLRGSLSLFTFGANPLAAFVLATGELSSSFNLTLTALAGGEFAIPVAQEDTTITIEFKEFGVAVNFTPTVLSSQRINLKLATEVSEIDESLGIRVSGISVPGLRTRRTSTTIELGDGESFMIAGLLQKDMNNAIDQFPGVGSVPVLGSLFRSTDFQRNQTELVIAVTPRLVKPVASGKLLYPSDSLVPPSDIDQYLRGRLEGDPAEAIQSDGVTNRLDQPAPSGGIAGAFGHRL
jgi:pilus assembly protein CpaC